MEDVQGLCWGTSALVGTPLWRVFHRDPDFAERARISGWICIERRVVHDLLCAGPELVQIRTSMYAGMDCAMERAYLTTAAYTSRTDMSLVRSVGSRYAYEYI